LKAVAITSHGGPEVLELQDLPVPEPGPGEVRVRVHACGINHLDLWVRKGLPHLRLRYPHILGSDVAGIVDRVGPGGGDVAEGARVLVAPGVSCGACARCLSGRDNLCANYGILGEHRSGGYAEFIVVPRVNLLPFPENLTMEEAASIPLVFLTAWQMVVEKARVEAGETVLVMGAGSGVSTAAIQIARLRGATIIAAAGDDGKLEKARALGAHYTINYRSGDLVELVRHIAGKQGVDVIIDHTGTEFFEALIRVCAWGGRIVLCGATSGYDARVDLRHIFYRQISILGSTMGSRGSLFTVVRLVQRGQLRPVLHRVFPLEQAREAHHLLESRAVTGKLVLKVVG
jgi:NADPH:quinone reductase-like Zn-dependent oxidoreductase